MLRPEVVELHGTATQEGVLHYVHRRDLTKTWCGARRERRPMRSDLADRDVSCVVCAGLLERLGLRGWHRAD